MSDDEDMFERAMEQLGTKRSARAEPRPVKKAPAGVEVSEDIDFEALMRDGRGPAQELRGAARKDAAAIDEPGTKAIAKQAPAERARYTATPEEAKEFLAAMGELGPPPDDRESDARTRARRASAEADLERRLKRGEADSDAVLDLHGKNQKEARSKLAAFIAEARQERWEIVTIVVGRGLRSDKGEAVLRPLVERWLREDHREDVREVVQAPAHMGGSGAWVAAIRL